MHPSRSGWRRLPVLTLTLAAVVAWAVLAPGSSSQEKQVVRGTVAVPRVGGITGLSHKSEHVQGLRVFGSVHVGPPVLLMEGLDSYAEGELVVPIACSFLFLQGSEWRETFDGLYFRRPGETDFLGFKTRVRSADGSGADDGHWEVDVSIRPREALSWSEVQVKHDITIGVNVTRGEQGDD